MLLKGPSNGIHEKFDREIGQVTDLVKSARVFAKKDFVLNELAMTALIFHNKIGLGCGIFSEVMYGRFGIIRIFGLGHRHNRDWYIAQGPSTKVTINRDHNCLCCERSLKG